MMSWETEHGPEWEIPQEILDLVDSGVLEDISWHHDLNPSFSNGDLVLSVAKPNPKARHDVGACGKGCKDHHPRYLVYRNEDGDWAEDVVATDDLTEALPAMGV